MFQLGSFDRPMRVDRCTVLLSVIFCFTYEVSYSIETYVSV